MVKKTKMHILGQLSPQPDAASRNGLHCCPKQPADPATLEGFVRYGGSNSLACFWTIHEPELHFVHFIFYPSCTTIKKLHSMNHPLQLHITQDNFHDAKAPLPTIKAAEDPSMSATEISPGGTPRQRFKRAQHMCPHLRASTGRHMGQDRT